MAALTITMVDVVVYLPTLVGQEQPVHAAIGSALEEAVALHLVQELAHIALGDQQRVGKLLLADAFGGADLGQYVELRRAELAAAQRIARCAIDFLKDTYQPQPRQQTGRAYIARPGCSAATDS